MTGHYHDMWAGDEGAEDTCYALSRIFQGCVPNNTGRVDK